MIVAKTRFPCKLVNPCNRREHWRVVSKRGKEEKSFTGIMLRSENIGPPPSLPLTVTITRIGAGRMDSDGLAASAKHIRDGVAAWVGVDDGDPRWTWLYAQRSEGRGVFAVEVEVRDETR